MFDLSRMNTLGVPARAVSVRHIERLEDLAALAGEAREADGVVVLGGGSNVVLGERIEGPVWLIRSRGIRAARREGRVQVTAAAGEGWHDLVRWCLGQGLSGLENLALIPGSVGAAPVQNIGAYGVELDQRFVELTALDVAAGCLVRMTSADCDFGYRTSLFKRRPGRFIIGEVTVAVDETPSGVVTGYPDVTVELDRMGLDHPRPVEVAEAVIRIRRRKLPDPRRVPNVGSFFKNPVVDPATVTRLGTLIPDLRCFPAPDGTKLAAAQLIERASVTETGGRAPWARPDAPVHVWPRQALVLTNPGHRAASEVLAVAAEIRSAVAARFGVRLELEPDTLGC